MNCTLGIFYRFGDARTGNKIPESCVDPFHCQTYSAIWLNGIHPTGELLSCLGYLLYDRNYDFVKFHVIYEKHFLVNNSRGRLKKLF